MYVSTFGCGFFISRDNGESWLQENYFIPTRGMVVDSTGRIWVGANELSKKMQGVYYTDNEGQSWNPANDGLQNNLLTDLFLSSDHYLYAICSYSSLYRMKIASSAPDVDFYSSTQAWPNPAKDKIHIRFSKPAHREVYCYSIQGQLCSKWKTEMEVISINLNNYMPGIYVLKIVDGQKTESVRFYKM